MTAVNRPAMAVAFLAFGFFLPPTVRAHDFTITQVVAVIKADGTFLIDMRVDVDALALGVSSVADSQEVAASLRALSSSELDRAVDRARNTILRRVRIRFDDQKVTPSVTFPDHDQPLPSADAVPTVLGTTARLVGRYPLDATDFSFGASRAFGAVQLTILDEESARGVKHVFGAGEDSPMFKLHEFHDDTGEFALGRYGVLGFEHIIPKGMDHILFVLGLFLLSTQLKPLLLQITAFTVAHSVTLALSMTGAVSLSSRIVEPLIAVSIAYVAVENICVKDLKPWRPVVVFLFGLLHGMGFAGVLQELGMPQGQFVSALVGFNLGVEFGQLAVVLMAFLVVGWFRHRPWYRKAIVIPLSLAIALVGTYWAIERVFLAA